jgi:hypothetical protein
MSGGFDGTNRLNDVWETKDCGKKLPTVHN